MGRPKKRPGTSSAAMWHKAKGLNFVEKKQVQKIVSANIEDKFVLKNFTNEDVVNAPGVNATIARDIDQGEGKNQRNGVQVRAKYIKVHVTAVSTFSEPIKQALVRFILYTPKIVGTNIDTLTVGTLNSRIDPEQFTVIMDRTFALIETGKNTVTLNKMIKWRRRIRFGGAGGETIQNHDLRVLTVSNNAAAPTPKLHGYIQLAYEDA